MRGEGVGKETALKEMDFYEVTCDILGFLMYNLHPLPALSPIVISSNIRIRSADHRFLTSLSLIIRQAGYSFGAIFLAISNKHGIKA